MEHEREERDRDGGETTGDTGVPVAPVTPLPPPLPPGQPLEPLGPWTRVLLLLLGWILILLGVAMLVLPGPGILTILLGAAVISLVSHWMHRGLERLFRPWPRAWKRVLAFRRRVHRWFGPRR